MSEGVSGLFDLHGRVALITGGTRGLGREMALAFAAAGADVVVASRKPEACAAVADEIHRVTGREALGHACHVGDWEALQGLVDAAWDRFGQVDVVVNNAGMSPLYPSPDAVTEALFDKVIDVNLKGPFRLTALAGPRMVAAGRGSIINVSSVAAVRPTPDVIPYAAAKAGLEAMTVAYARAYGPAVRVNAIQCGAFLTDISTAWDMAAFERRARTFALGRGGRPEEIAGTALYLASDASSYTTGAVIRVDGGSVGAEPPVTGEPDR
jgi:NAD(P)-dependent dehydrogenase (short-subunit alcohol dehydrogenase family)